MKNGWMANTCTDKHQYACQSKPACSNGWELSRELGLCYKVFNNATLIEAELFCRTQGAHAASVHSQSEDDFIRNLAWSPCSNTSNAQSNEILQNGELAGQFGIRILRKVMLFTIWGDCGVYTRLKLWRVSSRTMDDWNVRNEYTIFAFRL
ncbi:unnamed protein product, partial [Mesorhabditis spiculigera]